MLAQFKLPAPMPAIEATRAPSVEAAVHRLALRADRLRAAGDAGDANQLLLQAWAAFDA